jgi:type II secretory pathway pseudopilin PulG
MTTRDRLVLMTIVVLGVLAAGWLLGVSPEREKAAKLDAEVSAAQGQLTTAQAALSEAKGAQAQYTTAYASLVRLGQAVPADEEVPSLVYELDQASTQKRIEFNSIASGTGSGGGASSSASSTATAAATSAGFTQMPFTFVFRGTFFDLNHLLNTVDGFTLNTSAGVQVSGRLLTIQSISLERKQEAGSSEGATLGKAAKGSSSASGSGAGASAGEEILTGTITATAYVLPPGQGLTGGATSAGPAAISATAVSSHGSSGSGASPTAPAVVKVTP